MPRISKGAAKRAEKRAPGQELVAFASRINRAAEDAFDVPVGDRIHRLIDNLSVEDVLKLSTAGMMGPAGLGEPNETDAAALMLVTIRARQLLYGLDEESVLQQDVERLIESIGMMTMALSLEMQKRLGFLPKAVIPANPFEAEDVYIGPANHAAVEAFKQAYEAKHGPLAHPIN